MFHRPVQASCRLTARRRLSLGGLALTTALVGGAFVATPANAAASTEVHTFAQLDAALTGSDSSIVLANDFTASDKVGVHPEAITSSKTLDLNGHSFVNLDQTDLDDDVEFTVLDSTAVEGEAGTGSLYFNADSSVSGATSGVQLGDGATFHVSGTTVFATGARGGAGIGSASGAATFIADERANVTAYGSDHTDSVGVVDGGGAGIGGIAGAPGIDTTISVASVTATGATGAAGVGGGSGGDGGAVHLAAGGGLDAAQGAALGTSALPASSIGAGQDGSRSGSLQIDRDAYLTVPNISPLVLRTGAVVHNDGWITLDASYRPTDAIAGEGTVDNLGTIIGFDNDGRIDPAEAIDDPDVAVTGYNYDLTVDPNGGSIPGATTKHLYSGSVTDLVPDFDVDAPSDDSGFWNWNTAQDGSGTDVVTDLGQHPDLATLGRSTTGAPFPVRLYAKFARVASATADSLPDAVVGTAYRAQLPVAGDGLNDFQAYSSADPAEPGPGLPAGLSIDAATGLITGVPTEAVERDVSFTVSNLSPTRTVTSGQLLLRIAVGGAPVFGTTTLLPGTAGTAYSTTIAVSGDPVSYRVVDGALPGGLALDATTGAVTGTPNGAGSGSFTIRATNRFGSTDHAFTLGIGAAAVVAPAAPATPAEASAPPAAPAAAPAPAAPAAAAPVPAKPVLAAVARTTARLGHAVTLAVTADSTLPVRFAVTDGALPKGVTLNTDTGLITGAATRSGTFTAEVTATSTAGSATTTVVIVVPEVQQLLSTTGSVPAVAAGAARVPVTVKGFKKGERWTVRVDGKVVDRGTVKKAGTLSVKVRLSKAKKDTVHTIRIAGSRTVTDPAKTASTTFTVTSLAAKKTLRVHTVSANGTKLVAVERLAAGERVVVKDGSKVIASGHASEYGVFTFAQSKAGKGTSRLTVHGAAAKRAGKLTVKNAGH